MILEGMRKAVSYLEAKFGGESLPEVQMQRLATCFSCEWMLTEKRNSSGILDIGGELMKNPYYYCKKCGCLKTRFWPDAELHKKVTFDKAECPLNKWVR